MIGLRVKVRICVLAMFIATSCSSKAQPPKVDPTEPAPAAGSERWAEGALLLPESSPAVFVGRLDIVLETASRLKDWLVEEPAMFGDDGARIARAIDQGWLAATAYLGVDPLMPQAWVQRGVDPTVPIYAGLYPIRREERRYVGAVENVLREELGIAPGGAVAPSLQVLSAAGGEMAVGTFARIQREPTEDLPSTGLRVVVGVSSAEEFLITAKSFALGMGFREFPLAINQGRSEQNLISDSELVPAMSLRIVDDHAVFDFVVPTFGGTHVNQLDAETPARLHAALVDAVDNVPSGRAAAPAPLRKPALAVSFDQEDMSHWVRYRGYRHGLELLQSTSAERRDAALLRSFVVVASEAEAWALAGDQLTGTAYQLDVAVPGTGSLATAAMTIFGRHGLPSLDTSHPQPTLDLSRRSVGFGVHLAGLRTPQWTQWFGPALASELDALKLADVPGTAAPQLLRAFALGLSLLGTPEHAEGIASELGLLLSELRAVDHVELVSASPDVRDLTKQRQLLCSVVLPANAEESAVADVQNVLSSAVMSTSDSGEVLSLPKLAAGTLAASTYGTDVIHQQLIDVASGRVVLTGLGIDEARFVGETQALTKVQTVHGVMRGRLEPVALLPWLRQLDSAALDPLDVDILTQRLGALIVSYGAARGNDVNGVTLDLELRSPPEL